MDAGIFAFAPAVVINTPKYRTPGLLAKPMIGRPIRVIMLFSTRIGPLMRYLSPAHEVVHIRIPARTYGGATRHWDAATLKPMFWRRITGRK
jgi:hypothetical protein